VCHPAKLFCDQHRCTHYEHVESAMVVDRQSSPVPDPCFGVDG
jgi:hypothetical protein